MAQRGFALAAFREAGMWRCEALPPSVLDDLGVLPERDGSQLARRSVQPKGSPVLIIDGTEPYPAYCLFPAREPVTIESLLDCIRVFTPIG